MEVTTPNIFDYINSINNKKYIFEESEDKNYSQHLINYNFSLFPETIHIVNQLNEMKVTNKQHYDFLFNMIKKGKRYSKWFKTDKDQDLERISDIYNVNIDKAKELKRLLTQDEIEKLKTIKGGKNVE